MDKDAVLKDIIDCGVVAVVRAESSDDVINIAQALSKGGIKPIEITMTVPNALDALKELSIKLKDKVIIGAGTVLDSETARLAILSGAEFIVSPVLNPEIIKLCKRYSKIVVSGAYTPTEILSAWECGADIVKVFPATVGGPGYFKDIRGPLPQVKMMPTGGVNLDSAGDFIKAGAVAVAAGGSLIDKKAVKEGRFEVLTETAKKFRKAVGA